MGWSNYKPEKGDPKVTPKGGKAVPAKPEVKKPDTTGSSIQVSGIPVGFIFEEGVNLEELKIKCPNQIEVEKGKTINLEEHLEKPEDVVLAFFADKEFKKEFDFSKPVKKETDIYIQIVGESGSGN